MRDWRGNYTLIGGVAGVALLVGAFAYSMLSPVAEPQQSPEARDALLGEAREGGFTVALEERLPDIAITEAAIPGRPIVLIDPGHGGRDPGASGVSGNAVEKNLTLAFARELRDRLAKNGLVRVALTRDGDANLSLEQRAGIARKIGAAVMVSIHMDSAPNPDARGATIYSLSDVAYDAESAAFARSENSRSRHASSEKDDAVRSLLSDLALRDQMESSAEFADRLIRASRGQFLLRPEPRKFADFVVLRLSEVPGVLVEAGYISNETDEAILRSSDGRASMIAPLARAIEAEAVLQTKE